MTTKTLDWLNQNRFRAYPFVNDGGLIVGHERIPDCVLLDCLIVDTRHDIGIPSLMFTKIDIGNDRTRVYFTYSGISSHYDLTGGGLSGESSFTRVSGIIPTGFPSQLVHVSFTFSSHAYILDHVGVGTWTFIGSVIPSKVVSVTASGVSGIKTNGSTHVQAPGTASGIVTLVDGYRTQPVISNGRVLVKVGTHFGLDPCHYPRETSEGISCDDLMLFFCGQNAITSGNVVLQGGPGVNVRQGGTYTAKENIIDTYGNIGIQEGESVPCIEIIASSELMNIYQPSDSGSSESDSSSY